MKKTTSILLVLVFIVAGVALGFYIGKQQGEKEAENKLGGLIDMVFPKPPEIIHTVGGVVKSIFGATIDLEIIDPDDYLPHTDGSPQKKGVKSVLISGNTEIVLVNYIDPQPDGSPTITPLTLADLNPGDEIEVTSDENIRDAKKFDVTRVEVIVY